MRRCALVLWMGLTACRTAAPAFEGDFGQLEIDEAERASGPALRLELRLLPVAGEPSRRRRAAPPIELTLLAQPARSDDAEVVIKTRGESVRYGECQELATLADGGRAPLAQARHEVQTEPSGSVTEELRSAAGFEAVRTLAAAAEVGVSVCQDTFRASSGQRQTLQRFFKEWSARRR
jgi:hypothetical protein